MFVSIMLVVIAVAVVSMSIAFGLFSDRLRVAISELEDLQAEVGGARSDLDDLDSKLDTAISRLPRTRAKRASKSETETPSVH